MSLVNSSPKPFKIPRSTLIVIHTAMQEVLLIERADHPGYWQSVTGSQDEGETLERTAVRRRYGSGSGAVRFDFQHDLYASLSQAHAVISEVSTGLFEAVGVADKVFVWDTPKARFAYPTHPFQRYASVSMLADFLRQDDPGRISADALESVWAGRWQERYKAFLAEVDVHCGSRTAGASTHAR